MNHRPKDQRKAYAMQRMAEAIERAISAVLPQEQERAKRWAAAWGVISGIRSPGIRLRRNVLFDARRGKRGTKIVGM